jgi:hypothetical protein
MEDDASCTANLGVTGKRLGATTAGVSVLPQCVGLLTAFDCYYRRSREQDGNRLAGRQAHPYHKHFLFFYSMRRDDQVARRLPSAPSSSSLEAEGWPVTG